MLTRPVMVRGIERVVELRVSGTQFLTRNDTDNWHDELFALVHYRADPNWEISGGYRYWGGKVDESEMEFKYAFSGFSLGFSYFFF